MSYQITQNWREVFFLTRVISLGTWCIEVRPILESRQFLTRSIYSKKILRSLLSNRHFHRDELPNNSELAGGIFPNSSNILGNLVHHILANFGITSIFHQLDILKDVFEISP